MLRARLLLALAAAAFALAACAEEPFVVTPDPDAAAANGVDLDAQRTRLDWEPAQQTELITLCYSGQFSESAELEAAAVEACPSGKVKKVAEDAFWNGCPLMQSYRASYLCEPPTVVKVE